MPVLLRRLPWVALALTVLTAAVLLFGPLWDDARDENPLDRPGGVAWEQVLQLSLPTVMVAGGLLVALALPRRVGLAAAGLVVFAVAFVAAPAPLPVWFLPALVLTVAAVAVAFWLRRQESSAAREPAVAAGRRH
ncbi:hypothetical protein [Ornithinimicrobium sufpigmenti]|uniref:hypothetical protein n=1 Tax=Ornithinimicrobium sufpigmenti TaxID=2508882 RepID=UPI001035D6B1|nr:MULTISPECIES: hypothetical protein [unclassified Ornithinimicrobium]